MKTFASAVAGGACLGIGFVVPPLWFLVYAGIAFILYACERVSLTRASVHGFVAGLVLFGLAFYPLFWPVLPIEALGSAGIIVVALSWLVATLGSSLPFVVFGFFLRSSATNHLLIRMCTVPAAFATACAVSAWVLDVVQAGSVSEVAGHSTAAFPAYALANDPVMLQLASFGGIYALLFVVGVVGTLLYFGATKVIQRKMFFLALFVLALGWIGGYVVLGNAIARSESANKFSVASVRADFPVKDAYTEDKARMRFTYLSELLETVENSDIIVLPENAGLSAFVDAHPEERLPASLMYPGTVVVDSVYRVLANGIHNQIAYISTDTGQREEAGKRLLVPYGEYTPYWMKLLLMIPYMEKYAPLFSRYDLFVVGTPHVAGETGMLPIGAALCSEALSPHVYRKHVRDGAEILANLSSLRSFHGSQLAYRSVQNVHIVRAVENRRWLIVSGDNAPAYIIDPYGRVSATAAPSSVVYKDAYLRSDLPFAALIGDWIVLLFGAISIVGIFLRKRPIS